MAVYPPPLHPVVMKQYIIKYETLWKLSRILKADTVVIVREKRPIQSPPHSRSQ